MSLIGEQGTGFGRKPQNLMEMPPEPLREQEG